MTTPRRTFDDVVASRTRYVPPTEVELRMHEIFNRAEELLSDQIPGYKAMRELESVRDNRNLRKYLSGSSGQGELFEGDLGDAIIGEEGIDYGTIRAAADHLRPEIWEIAKKEIIGEGETDPQEIN